MTRNQKPPRSVTESQQKKLPDKEEWDFRKIPPAELLACCLYELTREALRMSKIAGEKFDLWKKSPGTPDRYTYLHLLASQYGPIMTEIDKNIVGRPWAKTREGIQKRWLKAMSFPEIRPDKCTRFTDPVGTSESTTPAKSDSLNEFVTEWGTFNLTLGMPSWRYGFYAINLAANRREILEEFQKWLDGFPIMETRNKNPDMNRWLTAIGVKRLLEAGLSPDEIRTQFGKPPYAEDSEFYRTKQMVKKFLRKVFHRLRRVGI